VKKFRGVIGFMVLLGIFVLPMAAMALTIGGAEVVKKGTGHRKEFGIPVYDLDLYVAPELANASAHEIITADKPMTVIMKITNPLITKDTFCRHTRKGFATSASGGYPTDKSEYYLSLFYSVDVKRGVVFQHDYDPKKKAMTVYYTPADGGAKRVLGVVPTTQFKAGLFGMWIGNKTIDSNLRDGMLGKK